MPITINGSGTITGLSVGGLPDGSVDLDTLAAGAGKGAGRILQVVSATTTSEASTTGAYTDSNLTKAITLASTSSKVLIIVNQAVGLGVSANTISGVGLKLLRDSTTLRVDPVNPSMWKIKAGTGDGGEVSAGWHSSIIEIDSPSTAGSVTYKTQVGQEASGTAYAQNDSRQSWIVLAEIGG